MTETYDFLDKLHQRAELAEKAVKLGRDWETLAVNMLAEFEKCEAKIAVLISVLRDIKERCIEDHDSDIMRSLIIDQIDDALKGMKV